MAYTSEDLLERIQTLEDGLLKVEKGVQFADRGVTYNSAAELRERIEYFRGLLAHESPVPARSKQTFGVARKGF